MAHLLSSILDVLNARARVAALTSGNGHLLQNPIAAIFNNAGQDSNSSSSVIRKTRNASGNSSPIKSSQFFVHYIKFHLSNAKVEVINLLLQFATLFHMSFAYTTVTYFLIRLHLIKEFF